MILNRLYWKITGHMSRYLVEDVEDRIDLVLFPVLGWIITASLIAGSVSTGMYVSSILLVCGAAFGYLAAISTAGSVWYATDADEREVAA